MSYTKTDWDNGLTDLNETNMNKIENELEAVDKSLKYIGNAPTNLNDAKTFGIYNLTGLQYTNSPINSELYGVLIVYENRGETWTPLNSSWIWQEVRMGETIYRRRAGNTSSSWTDWVPYYSDNVENPSYTVNSNVLTHSDFLQIVRIGKIVIVNFECQVSNLSNWQYYTAITLNNITAKHKAFGSLTCQEPKYPITIHIEENGNEILLGPYGNTFTGADWFRGQLVFIAN